ncbi:nuclear transport factor 2 family protein [Fodinicola feengrottensis]|uniref:Nuclear transport factor 2 family protein n=1 Tax=Fodinicola feengrottensis TaxID=435914 RepID=A0ABN2FZT8_9ACTN|nr:nuclear transport factor 2 family protein [Fodinicola feengrottensis]
MKIEEFLTTWAAAECAGDTTAIGQLLTDDFTAVGPLGFTLSKEDWLGRHASGQMSYESYDFADVVVRSYEDTAVAIVRQHAIGTFNGHPVPSDLRASIVLVRSGDSWLLSTVHMSFVAGTPGAPPIPGRG